MMKFAYSLSEFQQLGGPCKGRCYQLEKTGKLTLTKLGRNTVILHSEVERFFASLPSYGGQTQRDLSKAVTASVRSRTRRVA
jgi:hypothetical protein